MVLLQSLTRINEPKVTLLSKMAAGDTHAADPVDTVHHEMDSVVRSHRSQGFYKSV